MVFSNPEILELVSRTKHSIKNIKNTTREDITKIKKLAEEISKIVTELEDSIKSEEESLMLYEEELRKIECDETNKNVATIIKVITSNLPKDIKAYQINDSSIKLYPINTKEQEIKSGNENNLLGEIEIETKEDIFIIKVKIVANNNSCKFCLKKTGPLRIYKIIAYLNDFLSYDE